MGNGSEEASYHPNLALFRPLRLLRMRVSRAPTHLSALKSRLHIICRATNVTRRRRLPPTLADCGFFLFFFLMRLYRALRGYSCGSRGFLRGPDDGHNHRQGAASSTSRVISLQGQSRAACWCWSCSGVNLPHPIAILTTVTDAATIHNQARNPKLGALRNMMTERSKGDIVINMDNDDFFHPQYGTFRLNFHRFDHFELDLRGHTQP